MKLRGWVGAANVHVGDALTSQNLDAVQFLATAPRIQYARVYNLSVADLHTYYVLAGDKSVLVHNSQGCIGDRWTSPKNLDKHGDEMGIASKSEYDRAARDLMCTCGGPRPGVQIKVRGNT